MSERPIFDSGAQFFALLHQARNARKKGAIRVGVFGSRARGNHTLEKR